MKCVSFFLPLHNYRFTVCCAIRKGKNKTETKTPTHRRSARQIQTTLIVGGWGATMEDCKEPNKQARGLGAQSNIPWGSLVAFWNMPQLPQRAPSWDYATAVWHLLRTNREPRKHTGPASRPSWMSTSSPTLPVWINHSKSRSCKLRLQNISKDIQVADPYLTLGNVHTINKQNGTLKHSTQTHEMWGMQR